MQCHLEMCSQHQTQVHAAVCRRHHDWRLDIILDTTKTLLSRKRPAQFAMQLASEESSFAPGLPTHLSKQVSVSLLMAAWMTAFCCSVSMNICRSFPCRSSGSCPSSM